MSFTGETMATQEVHDSYEDFRPLAPEGLKKSPSQRLQHIHVPHGGSASFGHIVTKQWHSDFARGRSTWAVVMGEVDAFLLYEDICGGAFGDIPESAVEDEPVEEQVTIFLHDLHLRAFQKTGHLIIIPFECLRELLLLGLFVDVLESTWLNSLGSPTIVMDFNWGYTTVDMALSCSLVAKYIKASIRLSTRVMMACTVSNDTTTYFGKEYRLLQRVQTPLDILHVDIDFDGVHWHEPNERMAVRSIIGSKLFSLKKDREKGLGSRAVVVMDSEDMEDINEDLRPPILSSARQRRAGETESMALVRRRTYTGPVANVSQVIIYPNTAAHTIDAGQVVYGCDLNGIRRSRAEINYRGRHWQQPAHPKVCLIATEAQFQNSPAHCDISEAHTWGLSRLLICCKLIWPGVPFDRVPVYLPEDKHRVAKMLRILIMKGILAIDPDDSIRLEESDVSVLYERTRLTETGQTTARILSETLESAESAHLLAQLLGSSDAALSPWSKAVVDAIFSLAVVTETADGRSSLYTAVDLCQGTEGDRSWYDTQLFGVGAGESWRGSMWVAAAIWQRLRADQTWRLQGYFRDRSPLLLNGGHIKVDRVMISIGWDHVLDYVTRNWGNRYPSVPRMLAETRLTAEEMLAVEKALVRAYLDKLIYVTHQVDHTFQIWHVLSGESTRRPFGHQALRVWWDECRKRDGTADGQPALGTFCIYTDMIYVTDDTIRGPAAQPIGVTYVSPRAVRLVLEETGNQGIVEGIA